MNNLFPPERMFAAFLAASLLLAVTPGPGVLYIVTRSLAQGRRSGLASVAGVALGNLGNAVGASVGLAALFSVSRAAFTAVKGAGSLYLIYLGIKALRARPGAVAPQRGTSGRIFRDGFIVALLNPKTALFFAAFLPQFMGRAGAPALPRNLALGALFVAIAAATDTLYALSASTVAPALERTPAFGVLSRYLTGGVFIGLGLLAAFARPAG